jgi:hypothetical protein
MGLDKQTVRAGGERATRQHGSKLTLTARTGPRSAGQLHGMRGVKDHRKAKLSQDGN